MIIKLKTAVSIALIACLVFAGTMPFASEKAYGYTISKTAYSKSYMSGPYYKALKQVKLTGDQRQDIVNIALSQVGYYESNSSTNLSGVNLGSKNYTEYGRWSGKQGGWCAKFIVWSAQQAKVPFSTIPNTGDPKKLTGSWKTYTSASPLKPGDIVSIDGGNHVALVWDVTDSTVSLVEGNVKGKVKSDNRYYRSGESGWDPNWKIEKYFSPKYKVTTDTPATAKTYTIKFNGNGGKVKQADLKLKKGNTVKVTSKAATRTKYRLSGWNLYRPSDKKWYVSNKGWYTTKELTQKKYKKTTFTASFSKKLDDSWTKGSKSSTSQFMLYAVWKKR